jgi:hypothetical protein
MKAKRQYLTCRVCGRKFYVTGQLGATGDRVIAHMEHVHFREVYGYLQECAFLLEQWKERYPENATEGSVAL